MAAVKLTGFEQALGTLSSLPLEMRGPIINRALRKAGKIVIAKAYSLVPEPDYPGDKLGLTALRDTLTVRIKEYEGSNVMIAGPKHDGGQHGHLVEGADSEGENVDVMHHSHGRATGVVLKKTPFMGPASKITETQQRAAITDGVRKASAKAKR